MSSIFLNRTVCGGKATLITASIFAVLGAIHFAVTFLLPYLTLEYVLGVLTVLAIRPLINLVKGVLWCMEAIRAHWPAIRHTFTREGLKSLHQKLQERRALKAREKSRRTQILAERKAAAQQQLSQPQQAGRSGGINIRSWMRSIPAKLLKLAKSYADEPNKFKGTSLFLMHILSWSIMLGYLSKIWFTLPDANEQILVGYWMIIPMILGFILFQSILVGIWNVLDERGIPRIEERRVVGLAMSHVVGWTITVGLVNNLPYEQVFGLFALTSILIGAALGFIYQCSPSSDSTQNAD